MNFNIINTLLLAPALALGAPSQEGRVLRARWLMGTVLEIEAPDATDADANAAFEEVERWNRVLASCRHRADSENCGLTRASGRGPVKASPGLLAVTAEALRLAEETDGAFDPAYRAPGGRKAVALDASAGTISLPKGGELDFGGIGKGWALDRAAAVLRARGVRAARLNFGGQIYALGAPAGTAGWAASVPGAPADLLLKDESVSVSGDEQRPGHIVNPATGGSVRRAGTAAAIFASAAEADAWSTALFVLGKNPPSFRGRSYFAPGHPPKNRKGDRT